MKLLTLSLDGQPAHDVTGPTLATWTEALCVDRVWDEKRDVPRFRKAFRTLMTTCERWPSPKKFLDALPSSVVPFRAGPRLEHEGTRQARMQSFAEVRRKLGIPEPDDEPEPPRAA
ncbi:hypothetical protein SAMN02800692_2017 [Luteibacter sp. UNC138MFCol5.1]|uniref:hypothetical protein n=1 Tax=Luteibacter sp. UNC138MFCol5.1 TaxID=1502774 RepID=UPI0008D84CD9|nr:hypothetical protein [Luteibacter sp. UNC138MFCol5.1]SEO76754.1 hypothetical protein SAMN02800692_2017 [Luteibacter sp. UNC138MFCol5.1]